MQTKREALAEQGLAIAGARGKFSKAAMAWLEDARSRGVKFSDDDKTVREAKPTAGEGKPKAAKVVVPGDSDYIVKSDYRFPIDEYRAFYTEGGKRIDMASMIECCDCGYSFCNHPCAIATKYGNVVTIERV